MPSNTPNFQLIPAPPAPRRTVRVAAYCRVSTRLVSQETSLRSQQLHYQQLVATQPGWQLVGLYVDVGVSATSMRHRPELLRLLEDSRAGSLDLVLTKSISRLSRDTCDLLFLSRELARYGVSIRFDKEGILTTAPESELMLTLLAGFAQEESRSISGNVRWGIRQRFEAGSYVPPVAPFGYQREQNTLVVDERAAPIVARIYRMAADGHGPTAIARTLNAEAIPAPRGGLWSAPTVRKLVANPAYAGVALYQKTYQDDHYIQRRNTGERDRYLQLNSHPPLVSAETFVRAQTACDATTQEAVERARTAELDGSDNRRHSTEVQVIKASKQPPGAQTVTGGPLRAAAYCRVSTDSEEQESSYEAQVRHYTSHIAAHPGWQLVGIYADEGITGTSARRRPQFQALLADCEAGRIDLVLTKSISRWARNTVDSLRSIRRLRDLGIAIVFEKEQINTLDAAGEVLVTIMSSLAQQESDSISRNVRMGIQYRMRQGKPRLNMSRFLGLEKTSDGGLAIIPAEARLVRRIYRAYLDGLSPARIAAKLTREGVPTPAGGATWYASTVAGMLRNEKYCGDLLMQKYYVADFLTHRVVENTGQLPRYLVRDAHEPIVPRAVFEQVQGEMLRRAHLAGEPTRIRCGSARVLEGRLVCGLCGRTLKRCVGPEDVVEWRCLPRSSARVGERRGKAGCACRVVDDREGRSALVRGLDAVAVRRAEVEELWRGLAWQVETLEVGAADAACAPDVSEDPTADAGPQALERAELAHAQMQVRKLLELVDALAAPGCTPLDDEPACYGPDDFFRRTRCALPARPVDTRGVPSPRLEEALCRVIDRVVVEPDGYTVRFSCGYAAHV